MIKLSRFNEVTLISKLEKANKMVRTINKFVSKGTSM